MGTGGNTDERPRIAKVEQLRSPLLRAKGYDLLLPSCRRMLLKTLADDIVTLGSRLNRKTLPTGLALTEPGRLHRDHASHGITSWFVACMDTRNSMWHSVQVGTSGSIQFGLSYMLIASLTIESHLGSTTEGSGKPNHSHAAYKSYLSPCDSL